MAAPATMAATRHQASSRASAFGSASFQRASGPTPIRNTHGSMSGPKTASKYGGPTEILPALSASRKSG